LENVRAVIIKICHNEYVGGEKEICFGIAIELAYEGRTVKKKPKSIDVYRKS